MSFLGNILKTVGGIAGQILIPIPGVGAAIGSAAGGLVDNVVEGGDQTQQSQAQQPQGKLDPISVALQGLLSGQGGSAAAGGAGTDLFSSILGGLV